MTISLPTRSSNSARRAIHDWRYGKLVAWIARVATVTLLVILGFSLWQGFRLRTQLDRLESRVSRLQPDIDRKASTSQVVLPADSVSMLPDAPSVAQILHTLQQAADKEGARVDSLQASDHPPTDSSLGHLDLVVSIKAPYPAVLAVLQQLLDRYPGATIRQFDLSHAATSNAPLGGAMASPPSSETRAQVLLAVWRRPSGVARTDGASVPLEVDPHAKPGSPASAVLGGTPAERSSASSVAPAAWPSSATGG